ncbi:TetR/AcrR family transcriptional regulator [uncultured Enterococcus sp.]|uniref:TetR/AcrR family transcriptional regulator n=1 Tax=uncultured Enterococcus sp. TaxID=167972 RepID=UPI002AA7770B|nr:TetR/AcrR family transcriptional regulator [uncultured Enterococcus sp.]
MDSKVRKEQERRMLENKIIDAAVAIITEEGFSKLSIRKIATKIGYASGTIYNYYKNKDEILDHIYYTVYLETVEKVKATLAVSKNLPENEQLRMSSLIFIYTLTKYPEKFKVVMLRTKEEDSQEVPTGEDEQGTDILQKMIADGKEKGLFQAATDTSAELFLVALMGFVFHIVNNDISMDAQGKVMAEAYVDFLILGLK